MKKNIRKKSRSRKHDFSSKRKSKQKVLSEGKFEPPKDSEIYDINKSLTVRESKEENIFRQNYRSKSFNREVTEPYVMSEGVEDEPHSEQNFENLEEAYGESDSKKSMKMQ